MSHELDIRLIVVTGQRREYTLEWENETSMQEICSHIFGANVFSEAAQKKLLVACDQLFADENTMDWGDHGYRRDAVLDTPTASAMVHTIHTWLYTVVGDIAGIDTALQFIIDVVLLNEPHAVKFALESCQIYKEQDQLSALTKIAQLVTDLDVMQDDALTTLIDSVEQVLERRGLLECRAKNRTNT